MRRSLSLMSISISSASGRTATVAVEVWMRPWLSVLGDSLNAVNARFEFHNGVHLVARYLELDVLVAARF